ncbi:MAG: 30S ribosomal protein S14 [Thermodesulfovibrionia bacterium]|nr:30S ribosomal protein S14 [Thermodesulfovibrionia bacterium]
MSEEKKEKIVRSTGLTCRRCGTKRAVIRRYNLLYCRRCFREVAKTLGFEKFS